MTKAELLEALAAKAAELGVEPPSETKVESWINKKLFPGATPTGRQRGVAPDWAYTPGAIDAAFECLRLESLGAKRVTQLRIGLAIAGIDVATELLLKSLEVEGLRSIKRMRRDGWRNYVPSNDFTEANLKRASDADDILQENGLVPPPHLALNIIALAMSGANMPKQDLEELRRFLPSLIKIMVPDCGDELEASILEYMMFTNSIMAGIMGLPDETDAGLVAKIDSATLPEIKKALRIYRRFASDFSGDPAFKALVTEPSMSLLGNVFRSIEFQPLLLVLQISAVKNAPDWMHEVL